MDIKSKKIHDVVVVYCLSAVCLWAYGRTSVVATLLPLVVIHDPTVRARTIVT